MECFERLGESDIALKLDVSHEIEDIELNETVLKEMNNLFCGVDHPTLEYIVLRVVGAKCKSPLRELDVALCRTVLAADSNAVRYKRSMKRDAVYARELWR